MMKRNLPHFFIVGTVKGGTTSLYNYLHQHPDIYMSPIKEPHFFSTDINPDNFREQYRRMVMTSDAMELSRDELNGRYRNTAFIRDKEVYLQLFKEAGRNQVMGESSTSYLISEVAASNIQKMIPDAKIIIMLRDPVKRAYSHYLMNYRSGSARGSFREEVEEDMNTQPKGWGITRLYVDHGFYFQQVKRYLDIFGSEQVKIILSEDMDADTMGVVQDTYRFLGVNPSHDGGFDERHNSATIPSSGFSRYILQQERLIRAASLMVPKAVRSFIYNSFLTTKNIPALDKSMQKLLADLYREDVKKLQALTNFDLSGWLK
jgi:hypothetical protein